MPVELLSPGVFRVNITYSQYRTLHQQAARHTTQADLEYQLDQLVCFVVPW